MATVQIVGLAELQRGFRKASPQLGKALQKANKKIATHAVGKIKPAVKGLSSPGGSKAVGGITARAGQKYAEVAFSRAKGKRPLIANILGANWHQLWGKKAIRTSEMKNPVWRPHMGTGWKASELYGAGPIFTAIHKSFQLDAYQDAIAESLKESFPG